MDLTAEFFRHNAMANRMLLESCRRLGAEQLRATAVGTYGSVGSTLVHIANSQIGYAERILGGGQPGALPDDPFPGFDTLSERFADGDARLQEAAARAGEDRELRWTDPEGRNLRMPVALFLLQAVNHGTEHRSQVATILTRLGVEPPDMDGWTYFFASGQLVEL